MSNENNFIPSQDSYKPLTPFRLFVKSNFPFIENTFEAFDNYGLYCKIVEYLNNVIANENTVESNVQKLYNAFVSLNTYVSDYFDNLDVQEEINNKLDEMASNGELGNIINGLFGELQNQINSVASGSPAGVYATLEDLTTDNPNHNRIYVVESTGNWYYYNITTNSWASGGQYLSTGISEGSIGSFETNDTISFNINYSKTAYSQNYNKFVVSEFESGYITPSNGNNEDSPYTVRNKTYHTLENKEVIFNSKINILRFRYYCYNLDNSFDIENSSQWLSIGQTFTPLLNKKYRLVIGTNNASNFNMEYLKQCGFFYTEDFIENNIDEIVKVEKDNINNYNIDFKSMPFSVNANKVVFDSKKLSNFEEGTITYSNGNNLDGYPNAIRNKKAIEIKNCIIINLKPNKYRLRLIYYNQLGGFNSATHVGASGWFQQLVTKYQNENFSQRSIYSRLIIYSPNESVIDFDEAINSVMVINTEDKTNFKKPFFDVMAHQGGIGLDTSIPSNTLNAFTNCSKYDYTGFETDVRKTSDGVFVISHDVERTTTNNITVNINQTTYSDLQNMQFYADSTIKIPTLDETIKNAKLNGMKIDIELKDAFSENEITSICNLVKQNSMENHVVFSSFITTNLLYVRNIFPNVKVIIPMNEIISPETIETSSDYANYRTLRSQGKTLLSMTTDTMSDHISDVESYIANGFCIRVCYYGSDVTALSNYIKYADTILLNTEDMYPILYYFR